MRSVAPASAVCIRSAASQTVSPSGTRPVSPGAAARAAVSRSAVRPLTSGMTGAASGAGRSRELSLRLRTRDAIRPGSVPEPVTVTVARVVRADPRESFENWAEHVLAQAAEFPGNLGVSLLHPGPESSEYHLVYRFTDDASLAAWERSPERRTALAKAESMVDDVRYARADGLEELLHPRPPAPGPRWRMTLLTVVAVFAITSTFQQLVAPHLTSWPLELRLVLSAFVIVIAMAYVVMPALTRLFAPAGCTPSAGADLRSPAAGIRGRQPRRRRPRGVAAKPAAWSAAAAGTLCTDSPSAFSTDIRPSAPALHGVGQRRRPRPSRCSSSVQDSRVLPPRST